MLRTISRTRAADKFQVTEEKIISMLMENAMLARDASPIFNSKGEETGYYRVNFTASNQALSLLGKHIGMFNPRLNGNMIDSEASNQTTEELIDDIAVMVRKMFGIKLDKTKLTGM